MEDNAKTPDGAKIVASAILGYDFRRIVVDGKVYTVNPPTIHRLAAATYWLTEVGEAKTLKESLMALNSLGNACRALSCLICGDEGLWEELSHGTMAEVVDGLVAGFDLVDIQNFLRLSALTKSARRLVARQR